MVLVKNIARIAKAALRNRPITVSFLICTSGNITVKLARLNLPTSSEDISLNLFITKIRTNLATGGEKYAAKAGG